jgi:hypothetical protein
MMQAAVGRPPLILDTAIRAHKQMPSFVDGLAPAYLLYPCNLVMLTAGFEIPPVDLLNSRHTASAHKCLLQGGLPGPAHSM